MYCKNCGKELPENAKFCPKCGAEQEAVSKKKRLRAYVWVKHRASI